MFKKYKCNLKTIYLSRLNFETINTKLNIKYLYLSNLYNLERLELTEKSSLKELYIHSCNKLNYICLNIIMLCLFDFCNQNISSTEIYFEIKSQRQKLIFIKDKEIVIHSFENQVFNNSFIKGCRATFSSSLFVRFTGQHCYNKPIGRCSTDLYRCGADDSRQHGDFYLRFSDHLFQYSLDSFPKCPVQDDH